MEVIKIYAEKLFLRAYRQANYELHNPILKHYRLVHLNTEFSIIFLKVHDKFFEVKVKKCLVQRWEN